MLSWANIFIKSYYPPLTTRTTWISHLLHMLLFLSLVENAIKADLMRNTYGLYAPLGVKIPAAVGVWRWEVRKAS